MRDRDQWPRPRPRPRPSAASGGRGRAETKTGGRVAEGIRHALPPLGAEISDKLIVHNGKYPRRQGRGQIQQCYDDGCTQTIDILLVK